MKWLETRPGLEVRPSIAASLLLKAIEKHPDNPAMREQLGDVFCRCNKVTDAVNAYEAAAQQAPYHFGGWVQLAACYRVLGRPEAALDVCRRYEASGKAPTSGIHFQRGWALLNLRRLSEAENAFTAAISAGRHFKALGKLLRPLARKPDGQKLLDFCESLPQHYADSALVRANRAIALSRIGRTDEALQIVDLTRHVGRFPFVAPSEFEGLEQFNRELADAILADRSTATPLHLAAGVDYEPQLPRNQAAVALREFMKSTITHYLGELKERGLDRVMPPPPSKGMLFEATVVLRDDGRNGEHVHDEGYVSVVYHVLVPDVVSAAGDNRGALALGRCEEYTDGYTPCWGTRFIKPVAGWLTIFPSHIYHDVMPTRVRSPRISVVADLLPC
jgi:tetratricopeptide (TPR) repeat protein